jgi:hypothetical protein
MKNSVKIQENNSRLLKINSKDLTLQEFVINYGTKELDKVLKQLII